MSTRQACSSIGLLLVFFIGLVGCQSKASESIYRAVTASPLPTSGSVLATITPLPTQSSTAIFTPLPEASPTASPTPSPTLTPDPYAGLSIPELSARTYGGGTLEVQDVLAENSYFTRLLVTYPSDGLTIAGFMNVPRQKPIDNSQSSTEAKKIPVIIALHGYIDPAIYDTVDYTTGYADALARAGFIVIHPNLRGYPPSDEGDNRFRVGMAVDVLNLIAIIKDQSGQPGVLEQADPQAIGLWGHSMGGGITTRVLVVSPDVKAAILYAAMSADDQKNYERIYNYFSGGTRGQEELNAPSDVFSKVSPANFLDRISASVGIHHGKQDADVPLAWSLDLCTQLQQLGKDVECFIYNDQPHTFHGEGNDLFVQRMIDFFWRKLRP